jgi:hypothetical protein
MFNYEINDIIVKYNQHPAFVSDPKTSIAPDIDIIKANSAIAKYAMGVPYQDILIQIDNTAFGNAKKV